jgi:hypothetical protein
MCGVFVFYVLCGFCKTKRVSATRGVASSICKPKRSVGCSELAVVINFLCNTQVHYHVLHGFENMTFESTIVASSKLPSIVEHHNQTNISVTLFVAPWCLCYRTSKSRLSDHGFQPLQCRIILYCASLSLHTHTHTRHTHRERHMHSTPLHLCSQSYANTDTDTRTHTRAHVRTHAHTHATNTRTQI